MELPVGPQSKKEKNICSLAQWHRYQLSNNFGNSTFKGRYQLCISSKRVTTFLCASMTWSSLCGGKTSSPRLLLCAHLPQTVCSYSCVLTSCCVLTFPKLKHTWSVTPLLCAHLPQAQVHLVCNPWLACLAPVHLPNGLLSIGAAS